MSKHNRKRRHGKHEPEIEIIAPRNKFKTLNKHDPTEEAKLSEALFGGAEGFLESLEEAEQEVGASSPNVDSGIGETDSEGERKARSPAWVDEEDEDIDVGIALDSQNRRLPDGGINSRSNEYKKLLKHKFETIIGKPKWASLDERHGDDSDDEVLRTCGFVSKRIKTHLPESTLEYKKLKDLNYGLYADAQVNILEYHPTSSVSLVGGSTGIATLFAVDGRLGEIHILSTASKERIALLKQDHSATSLCFNPQGSLLYSHSTTGEIVVWDTNMRRAKYKWIDDGCIHGTKITISNSNQFIATGSAEGVVNVYDAAEITLTKMPKPKKAILNLATTISDLKFNSSSEMLAFSSEEVDTAVRLLHLGSMTVFNNFPNFGTKLGHLTAISFSPGSGYLSLG
ncbi:WD40 domain-containing protein, partial [Oryctes borbonicus]